MSKQSSEQLCVGVGLGIAINYGAALEDCRNRCGCVEQDIK